jgi:group I intron endonuclease
MIEKKSGIYSIVCDKTWRSYVGSSVNLQIRRDDHFQQLRANKHENSDLQHDFNMYGENCFVYQIIEEIEENKILEREDFWIKQTPNCYNKTKIISSKIELTEKEQERFWKWVDIKGKDDCWNWIGAKDKDGYGRIGYYKTKKKKMYRSNRLAYYIINPNVDIFQVVCHKCDNPSCCNPDHLFLGSYSDNAKDRRNKGRHANQQLSWKDVNIIRTVVKYLPTVDFKEIGNILSFDYAIFAPYQMIKDIVHNKKWTDKAYTPIYKRKSKYSNIK